MDARREQLEAFPYELDVCDVCGEVFRDADRGVVHGCLTVAPPFGDVSVLYRLQAIAADAEKQGLGVVSLIAGAELFNALEREARPYLRRDEPMGYWRLRTRHVHSAWRRTIAIGGARVSVDLERTLPVWALQVRRPTYRAHPTLNPYEVGRIARGLFDRDELRAMYDRPSPLLGMLPKRENFSGPAVPETEPELRMRNRAERRADRRTGIAPEIHDSNAWNGTPRALRTTRKPWER